LARSARSLASVPISACLQMAAQLGSLLQQLLARAQQVPVLFLLSVWWLHDRQQAVGVVLRQVAGINAVGFDRFTAGRRNTARRDHIAVHAAGPQVALQIVADIGGFVTEPDRTAPEMTHQLVQLGEQPLQHRPASEIDDFTGLSVEG
jgi:hypothetical protein